MSQPIISVVLASYNRLGLLERTLPALLLQDFPATDYEIIVVVDGSTDDSAAFLRSVVSRCRLRVIEQENRGQTAALNRGLEAATGRLVLFLDDDLLCTPQLLREHVNAHASSHNSVVIGPMLPLTEESPSLAGTLVGDSLERYFRALDVREPTWPDNACVGPNTSSWRELLLMCDGYDEVRFPRRLEDIDLGIRLWKKGARFRFNRNAVSYHIASKRTPDFVDSDAALDGWSDWQLCVKHPEYRSKSVVARLMTNDSWKSTLIRLTARTPFRPERALTIACSLTERLSTYAAARRLGKQLLQADVDIVMLRNAMRAAGSRAAVAKQVATRLPILLYHHVGPSRTADHPELSIRPDEFSRQVTWLARRGYTGIHVSDWIDWCRDGSPMPPKPVLFTFDDAYADVADYALPVLKQQQFGAVVFVITGRIGDVAPWDGRKLMDEDQIRFWSDEGVEFGAHSRTHADLTQLSVTEVLREISGSREDLARVLGATPTCFAYPFGNVDEVSREVAERFFELAMSCEEGLNDIRTNAHALRRTMVHPGDTLLDLELRVRMGFSGIRRIGDRLRIRSRLKKLGRDLVRLQ